MTEQAANLLRELPSVDRLLKHSQCEALLIRYNRDYIIQKCREILEELRADIKQGKKAASDDSITDAAVLSRIEARMERESRPGLVRVINATGTILHTNLGRALLSQPAIDAVVAVAGQPVNLEYDLTAG